MGQILYQRPREKLRERGVRALSNSELLQIIIGSGSQGVSAARIAKNVAPMLELSKIPSYQSLLNIRGMGHAKTAQIIAGIELGSRLQNQTLKPDVASYDFSKIKTSSKQILEYVTLDGTGRQLQNRFEVISDKTRTNSVIRKMFAGALHDYAGSLLIGIGSRTHRIDILDNETLKIMKMIFDTATLLEIKVNEVWIVNQTGQRSFRRKEVQ